MFDPKTLQAGEVIEFLTRNQKETLRGKISETKFEGNHAKHPFLYVQILGQDGNPLDAQGSASGLIELDRVLGRVDDGPLSMKERMDWDHYFMAIADVAATRATCDRKHVGSVIVMDKTILSTGYNGSIRGVESCRERGHMMEDGHCVRTVHAEANAIVQAAKNGAAIDKAELYTTASPCWWCFKLIANGGIKRVVFGEMYRDQRIFAMASRSGIEVKIL